MLSALIKQYKWAAIAVTCVACIAFFTLWLRGVKDTAFKAGQANIRAVYDAAASKALSDKQIVEDEISRLARQSTERMQSEINSANDRVAVLDQRLRERPARPSGIDMPASSPAASCGTGAGLYRDDGQFLAWLAGDAAKRGSERDECRREYETIERKLRDMQ